MTDWRTFWQQYRLIPIENSNDLLFQVGKTVGGVPYCAEAWRALLADIDSALDLRSDDRLLDLCCGNGILSAALAPKVREMVGVDFSVPFLENAKQHCARENLRYEQCDILDAASMNGRLGGVFPKVLLYDAMAYFDRDSVERLFEFLLGELGAERILLGAVLFRPDRGAFLNTWRRKFNYWWTCRIRGRTKGLGKWWSPREFEDLAAKFSLDLEIRRQDSRIPSSHYRRDILLRRSS